MKKQTVFLQKIQEWNGQKSGLEGRLPNLPYRFPKKAAFRTPERQLFILIVIIYLLHRETNL
jgi:hypothetical protein